MNTAIKNNNNIENAFDKKISIALMAPFVILTIQYFVLIYFNLIGTQNASIVQLISKALVGLIFLYALPVVLKRSKIKFIIIYLVAIFIFMINYLFFPEKVIALQSLIFPFFFMCLPAFVYSLSLKNLYVLKQIMIKASYIIFIFGTVLGGMIFLGRASVGAYSMSLSYYMLFPTIMLLDSLLDKISLRVLLFTFISLLVILALGSRGAVLCVIIFVFLKITQPNTKLNYQKTFACLGAFSIGVIGYIFLDRILEVIYNMLLSIGIKSRSIMLFLRDEIHLSGRDYLYKNLFEEILDNPLLGLGLGGDRIVLEGSYAHNIFLEILSNFGILFGTIIIVLICILILRMFLIKDAAKYNIFIIWLSFGFVHLMISGSYLININFWIFLGIAISLMRSEKARITMKL